MQFNKDDYFLAVFFSVALHALVFSLVNNNQVRLIDKLNTPEVEEKIVFLEVLPPPPEKNSPASSHQAIVTKKVSSVAPAIQVPQDGPVAPR